MIFGNERKEKYMKENAKIYSAYALLILCGIYLAALICGSVPLDMFSPLISFIAFFILVTSVKKWTSIIFPAAVYFLAATVTMSIDASSAFICIYTATVMGSYIVSTKSKWHIILTVSAPAVMSYAISLTLTRDPIISLSALVAYPVLLSLGICTRRCVNRKNSIIYTSVCCVISLIVVSAAIMHRYGISIYGLSDAIENAKNSIATYMSEYTVEIGAESMNIFKSAEYIREYLDSIVNILPGTLIALIVILIFSLQSTLFSTLKKEGLIEYMTGDVTEMDISLSCAVIYMITFILSFTTNSEGNLMLGSVAAQNIYLTLTPALIYVAIKSINSFFAKRRIRPTFLLIIPAVLLLTYGILSVALSFIGATVIIAARAKKYADSGNKKENGQ